MQAFEQRLEQSTKAVKSIESSFTQVKHLDVFDNDITLKGKFYYKHNNKICLDYAGSLDYAIIINGDKLKIIDNGKKNIVNLTSNKTMKEMQGMLTACMSGDISLLSSEYEMDYFEDSKYFLVIVKPKSKVVQEYIKDFHIYFNKKDMSVDKLRISESATDYTDYTFSNKKINSLQNDEKFSVN
jgi:outer membrane lipoprotein-sorting protein